MDNIDDMYGVAFHYFENLFSESSGCYDTVLNAVNNYVGVEDLMHLDKSPRPYGLNLCFYQKFWPVLGGDKVVQACSSGTKYDIFPSYLNATNVVLAPKCENPTSMKDLRPISLYNVLYKIMSKAIANRLRNLITNIISEEHVVFVPGRYIIENVLMALNLCIT